MHSICKVCSIQVVDTIPQIMYKINKQAVFSRVCEYSSLFMSLPPDAETELLSNESLHALHRLAASEDRDLQMTAAMYYLHLSHQCE